jgi:hypothetical protein
MFWTEAGLEHVQMYLSFPAVYERRVIELLDAPGTPA